MNATGMQRGAIVGASYFAAHHIEAWRRIPGVAIVGVADLDLARAEAFRARWDLPRAYPSLDALLDDERPEFLDIVTGPESHLCLARQAVDAGIDVICQKPIAPTWDDAAEMAGFAAASGRRLIVHDNWRWQPWFRWARARIDAGAIGTPRHARMIVRLGDGIGPAPYPRQPYFRDMPRLLVYETLVHHFDTLAFLLGAIAQVHCVMSRRNPVIAGEDTALVTLRFASGATAMIDATRVAGPPEPPTGYGLCVIDGDRGSLTLHPDGHGIARRGVWLADSAQEGEAAIPRADAAAAGGSHATRADADGIEIFERPDPRIGYRGDSVRAAQAHYVACLAGGRRAETEIDAYLPIVRVVDACYASARTGQTYGLTLNEPSGGVLDGTAWIARDDSAGGASTGPAERARRVVSDAPVSGGAVFGGPVSEAAAPDSPIPPRPEARRPAMLGVIADDVTGAADLAGMLTSRGVRTLMCVDRTEIPADADDRWDAIVMALKTRAIAPHQAVARSQAALDALRHHGVRQVFFKYCSTFDSTAAGNIGPVLDALLAALEVPFCSLVPALPVNGRTQYLGYLFVDGGLLSESSLRDHPLNPMRDPNLARHLQRQTRHCVGLVPLAIVGQGAAAIRDAARAQQAAGVRLALVDAIGDRDLLAIAEAFADDPLISGGSGLALALPEVWRARGLWQPDAGVLHASAAGHGPTLILCGSCSARTREQVRHVERTAGPVLHVDTATLDTAAGADAEARRLLDAVRDQLETRGWSLVASCSGGAAPRSPSDGHAGDDNRAARIEALLGRIAHAGVFELGVRSLLIAGGETSGAVARRLNLSALHVGPQLDPGVPICTTRAQRGDATRDTAAPGIAAPGIAAPGMAAPGMAAPGMAAPGTAAPGTAAPGTAAIAIVLKSGNFGAPDLFTRALHAFGHPVPDRPDIP